MSVSFYVAAYIGVEVSIEEIYDVVKGVPGCKSHPATSKNCRFCPDCGAPCVALVTATPKGKWKMSLTTLAFEPTPETLNGDGIEETGLRFFQTGFDSNPGLGVGVPAMKSLNVMHDRLSTSKTGLLWNVLGHDVDCMAPDLKKLGLEDHALRLFIVPSVS